MLINLTHVDRLAMCAQLPGYEFVVPEDVREEICEPAQRSALDAAVGAGALRVVVLHDLTATEIFVQLRRRFGRGESACLALATVNGWLVATDEGRRFRREVEARVGTRRVLGTVDLFLHAIRSGLLTVEEADADKKALEGQRFKLGFASFANLLGPGGRMDEGQR